MHTNLLQERDLVISEFHCALYTTYIGTVQLHSNM